MPTLTAPAAARAAVQQSGLVIAAEPAQAPAAPTAKPRKAAALREQQRLAHDRLWPILVEVFPDAFSLPTRPLAIGIHRQILDIAGDSIDPAELGAFMRYWTMRQPYRLAVWRGEPRRNLDGSEAGAPTIEQRNAAGRELWGARHQAIVERDEPKVSAAAD